MQKGPSRCCTLVAERATFSRALAPARIPNRPHGTATMLNSVRARLTLWYTAAMTIVFIVLAIATYGLFWENVSRRTDVNATELANAFLSTVEAEQRDPGAHGIADGVAAALSEHQFEDVVFLVFGA